MSLCPAKDAIIHKRKSRFLGRSVKIPLRLLKNGMLKIILGPKELKYHEGEGVGVMT
jgi:hypothetical protein